MLGVTVTGGCRRVHSALAKLGPVDEAAQRAVDVQNSPPAGVVECDAARLDLLQGGHIYECAGQPQTPAHLVDQRRKISIGHAVGARQNLPSRPRHWSQPLRSPVPPAAGVPACHQAPLIFVGIGAISSPRPGSTAPMGVAQVGSGRRR